MSVVARAARQLKLKAGAISVLKAQLRANQTNLKRANATIQRLEAELSDLREEQTSLRPFTSPADRILADILENAQRHPNGRRYSLETLIWGRRVHDISPHAWRAVRKVLPLPGKRLLLAKFTETKGISDALIDSGRIGELIDLWRQAVRQEGIGCPVVLSVDAVAFRPVITVHHDGRVEGLKTMNEIENLDLLSQFLSDPGSFVSFVKDHWDETYSALFAFQLQPLNPMWPCSIIHTMPAMNGKGTEEVTQKLLELKDALTNQFHFSVVGLAFDGDSSFNRLHDEFRAGWMPLLSASSPFPSHIPHPVIISDPLHVLKRIRYRWVSAVFTIGVGSHGDSVFSTAVIESWNMLPPIVFLNSRITKMHDSLPLRLFSPSIFGVILRKPPSSEYVLTPWSMLVAGLILTGYSTATRAYLLEIGFWYLFCYHQLIADLGYPPGVSETIGSCPRPSLYTKQQIRDTLNTFVALIAVLRNSADPLCLNRLGTGPLEHAFGRGRIRCHDVNTMKRLVASFAAENRAFVVDAFLALAAEPRRRASVGVDCQPFSPLEPTLFVHSPRLIAISLLHRTGIDITSLWMSTQDQLSLLGAWEELKRIREFHPEDFDERTSTRVSPERKACAKTLSSNQIFLGVISSPRPFHIISMPTTMTQAIAPHLEEIENWLRSISPRRINNHELESRVRAIAARIRVPQPTRRHREVYLQWIHDNFQRVAPILVQLVSGY